MCQPGDKVRFASLADDDLNGREMEVMAYWKGGSGNNHIIGYVGMVDGAVVHVYKEDVERVEDDAG